MENFNDSKALAIEIAKILDKKKARQRSVGGFFHFGA